MNSLQKRIELEALITERDAISCQFALFSQLGSKFAELDELEKVNQTSGIFYEKLDSIAAKIRALNEPSDDGATVDRLMKAVNWLMGCNGNFEPPNPAELANNKYWYRSALARQAGLVYDSEKLIYVIGGKE